MRRLSRSRILRALPLLAFLWLNAYQWCDAAEDLGENLLSRERIAAPAGGSSLFAPPAADNDYDDTIPSILGQALPQGSFEGLAPALLKFKTPVLDFLRSPEIIAGFTLPGTSPPDWVKSAFAGSFSQVLLSGSIQAHAPPLL